MAASGDWKRIVKPGCVSLQLPPCGRPWLRASGDPLIKPLSPSPHPSSVRVPTAANPRHCTIYISLTLGFLGSSDGKVSACNAGDLGSIPGLGRSLSWKDPLEKELETHSNWSGKNWQPTPVGVATHSNTLAWKILWTESLAGYSQWGHKESDTTKQLTHSLTLPHL